MGSEIIEEFIMRIWIVFSIFMVLLGLFYFHNNNLLSLFYTLLGYCMILSSVIYIKLTSQNSTKEKK